MFQGKARAIQTSLRLVAVAGLCASVAAAQKTLPYPDPLPTRIGASAPIKLEPKLEQAFENMGSKLWADMIGVPNATFLKAHLVDVNLQAGDVLRLISKSGQIVEEIRGRGPKDQGTFWALSAFGDELLLEFRFNGEYSKAPFRIDQVILGDPVVLELSTPESVCSPEHFDDVVCYDSDSGKWDNVLASVGVMSVGGNPVSALWCSGANVSPNNYVLTNAHCITSQASCDSSEFVFKFYRTGCNNGSPVNGDWEGFRCDDVVATKPFISCDQGLDDLDYALCSVIGDPAATYGFATPDPVSLTDGEDIYIVQHPSGRPHEITHGGGLNVDVDGTVLRYYDTLDTEGGSSGSPIFRESDDKLIGLHHCGGCSTPGTGNRGMLMSDIYPEISSFLCTNAVDIETVAVEQFQEVHGDGDTVMEPGESWEFVPQVRNQACDLTALAVSGEIQVNAASAGQVMLMQGSASFGDVLAGTTSSAVEAVRFRVRKKAVCGTPISFDLVNLQAGNGGPFPDSLSIASKPLGEAPITSIASYDFTSTGDWTIVDGGTGAGAASMWTTTNPGGRSLPLAAPYFIVDSDELGTSAVMDEELISPVISCAGFSTVQLQFTHDFHYYSGGMAEQADVEIRSFGTGGQWVNVANFQGADTSGTVTIDVTAEAAGRPDVQVRFHYYDASFEWWWAVDDVFLLGDNGFECDVFGNETISDPTSVAPGAGIRR